MKQGKDLKQIAVYLDLVLKTVAWQEIQARESGDDTGAYELNRSTSLPGEEQKEKVRTQEEVWQRR